jgi:C4-dicarboxylate transporter DctQ subunit
MDKIGDGKRHFSLWRVSDALLDALTVAALAVILVLMTTQIIMRHVFRNPLQWPDEISRMAMVWMTFLGSVIAFREKGHICVDLLTNSFPHKLSRIMTLLMNLMCIGFLCMLTVTGFQYVKMNINTVSLVTGVSKGLTYTVIPISSVWMILYIVRNMLTKSGGGK